MTGWRKVGRAAPTMPGWYDVVIGDIITSYEWLNGKWYDPDGNLSKPDYWRIKKKKDFVD